MDRGRKSVFTSHPSKGTSMTEHNKPTKVEFAPGCFDDFEGTQEELNELIADLKNMVTSGTLWENTLPVDEKEEEELIKLLAQKQARRKQ